MQVSSKSETMLREAGWMSSPQGAYNNGKHVRDLSTKRNNSISIQIKQPSQTKYIIQQSHIRLEFQIKWNKQFISKS